MADKSNFDALDILAGAIGLVLAFVVLGSSADRGTERLVVVVCVAAAVAIKRLLIRTRSAKANSSVVVRMCYLFVAFTGTACVGLALLATFAGVDELAGAAEYLAGSGAVLLILAAVVDSVWLKAPD